MLCSITGGRVIGNRSPYGSHLLYIMLFWSDYWHRYELNFILFYIYLLFRLFCGLVSFVWEI